MLEYKLRGDRAGLEPTAEGFQPRKAADQWNGLSQEARGQIAPNGSGIREDLESLGRINSQDRRRPTRATPGAGGNTMNLPTRVLGTLAAPVAVMAYPALAAKAAALGAATLGLAYAPTNQNFVRWVGNARQGRGIADIAETGVTSAAPAIVQYEESKRR